MTTAQPHPAAWAAHDEKVRPYVRAHRTVSSLRTLVVVLLVWWVLASRQLVGFEAALTVRGASGFSLFLWFFGTLAVLWEVISFPLSLSSYLVDRRFGVSRQTLGSWYADHLKGLMVGGALSIIVLLFTWFAVTRFGTYWWLGLAFFFVLFSVVLAQLAPVLLLPLFFKMNPLPEGELRGKLIEMSARYGVSVGEIYLLGLGDKTEKGNAAFMGLGKTKRIAIGDTIYEKYPADQVLAVFAHELGHMIHKDIWKGLALSSATLFLTFGLADAICQNFLLPRWFTFTQAPFGLFLYFVTVSVLGIPLGILEKAYSRWRERLADTFAAKELKMGRPLAAALEALTYQNRSYFVPNALREFFLFSHPAPWRRITRLRTDILA
jgi:STE24 endopeptidase